MASRARMIQVCEQIQHDAEFDMHVFEGREFNGRNVAELLGNQAASISTLARMVEAILKEEVED